MSDETTSQEGGGSEVQETTTKVQETTKSHGDNEATRLRDELQATRKEAASYRVKLKEFENSKLSETEKLQNTLSELQQGITARDQRLQELQVSQVLQGAVAEAGVVINPQLAARLVNRAGLDLDRDGVPTDRSVAKAIKELKDSEPNLFGSQSWDGGVRPSAPVEADMNSFIRRATGRN